MSTSSFKRLPRINTSSWRSKIQWRPSLLKRHNQMVWPKNLIYAFFSLIRRYWLPETTAKIQVQSWSYFLLRKRNFHIGKLLKTLNLIVSKKKNTHRLDFCPKPLDYVPLKFPLKNESLIETKIKCCSQWKKASKKKKARFKIPKGKKLSLTESFSVFALSSKVYIREFYQNTLTAKVRPVYCLKISHLQKFISVKWKNVAVPPNREIFCPSKYFILYNNFLWNINFAS